MRAIALTLLLVTAGLTLAGCDDPKFMSMFDGKRKLPGERKEVFPGGAVPGVQQGVPPELMKGYRQSLEQQQQQAADAAAEADRKAQEARQAEAEKAKRAEAAKPKPKPKRAAQPKPAAQPPQQAAASPSAAPLKPWPGQPQQQAAPPPPPPPPQQQAQQASPPGTLKPWPGSEPVGPPSDRFSR